MTVSENDLIEFGTLIGLHGLRGDLKVKPVILDSDILVHAKRISLRNRDGVLVDFTPTRVSVHKGNALLQLEGVETVDQAESLVGSTVLIQETDLPDLPMGKYYWHQLQGLSVFDSQRGDIGRLDGLFTTAAHDIYEVNGRFGEVLVPVVDAFILEVDLKGRQIQVDLPEGLIPESDEN